MNAQRIEVNTKEKAERIIHSNNGKRRMRWWFTYCGERKVYLIFYEPLGWRVKI